MPLADSRAGNNAGASAQAGYALLTVDLQPHAQAALSPAAARARLTAAPYPDGAVPAPDVADTRALASAVQISCLPTQRPLAPSGVRDLGPGPTRWPRPSASVVNPAQLHGKQLCAAAHNSFHV